MEIIRDSAFGHIARALTKGRVLQYEEEKNPDLWKRYIHHEKTANMAQFGQTTKPEPENEHEKEKGEGKDFEKSDEESSGKETSDEHRPSETPTLNHNSKDLEEDSEAAHRTFSRRSRPAVGQDETTQWQRGEFLRSMSNRKENQLTKTQTPRNDITNTRIDPEKGKDHLVVHWWSKTDSENPQNWTTTKKCMVTAALCLLTFAVYIGSAIFSAGETSVEMAFGVSAEVGTLGLSLFVLGYGLGPMIWAPLSEIPQVGRNPIYIGTLVVFVVFQLGVIFAKNIGMLLAFRFLTGFFGSPVLATGGASLADIWSPRKRAYAIAIWGLAAICGPVLGPLVGGFAAENPTSTIQGYQWPIWELMWLSGFALLVLFFFLPETSSNNILYRRTRRIRNLTGNKKITCESELMSAEMTPGAIAMMVLVRPFTLNFQEPIIFLLNLYIALVYALLYCWFESFAIVFIGFYGFTEGALGLAYLGIFVGGLITLPPFFVYLYYWLEPKFDENGDCKPELRLPPAMVGAFCLPICLFWFGWTANPSIPWIVPIIGSSFFTIGAFLLFQAVLNYLGDAYPEYAASVLAGNDFMRSSFGGAFPLFATQMYTKLGVGGASSLLGGLSILFIPAPFLLYIYGERIRKASKRARHDI